MAGLVVRVSSASSTDSSIVPAVAHLRPSRKSVLANQLLSPTLQREEEEEGSFEWAVDGSCARTGGRVRWSR